MKKLKLLLLVSLFIPNLTFADGDFWTRNRCENGWQFKARARVQCFAIPKVENVTKCPLIDNGIAMAQVANNSAWQRTINNNGVITLAGEVVKNKWACARGLLYSDLFTNASNYLNSKENYMETSEIQTSKILFKQNNVDIESITGFLKTTQKGVFSSFEVTMWLPQNSQDSIITETKTFFRGKVELRSGKLIVTGDFDEKDFVLRETSDGMMIVSLNELSISAKLPDGIDGENDLIEVKGTSDGGYDESHFLNEFEEIITISISPNPTSDQVTLKIKESTSSTSDYFEINIYDFYGELIPTEALQIRNELDAECKINFLNLNLIPGLYKIVLKSNDLISIHRIIFN